jgi:hypothetical protein
VSLGTTPTSKSPQLIPSRFTNHLRTVSVRILHDILTIRMEPCDFIKSSALYLSIHMELSLCLSFYLRPSLRGYKVGTPTGFPVKVKEALAPQSHCRIPQKCPQYHMSTYFAHHRVTGSGHPLNGGLGGYCQGNLPHVPWATGYGPKILDTIGSPSRKWLGNQTPCTRK